MITRISKIARLPLALREQLNQRLQNGDFGQPLLEWLNQEPIVINILAQWFNGQPINKQNLSDWRHGGYQDWLRHQTRQQTIQRLAEQGGQLTKAEGSADLCESFSRIVIAEMAEELEHLHEITDRNERWKRLREISRELSRLQHGFNHSRSVELVWSKYNDQFEPVNPSQPQSSQATVKETTDEKTHSANHPPAAPVPETVSRYIYHRRCGRGCVCPDCHPEDGEYPYPQAVQDDRSSEDHTSPYWNRGPLRFWVTHVDCDCYCDCAKTHPFPSAPGAPLPAATAPGTQPHGR